jgi:hypothetical protein
MRTEGSAGQDPNARTMRRFAGDEQLLSAARAVRGQYRKGQIVEGVIASSEVWNSELDRIQSLHARFGTTAEEMEAASSAQIAGLFEIPFLGIRVVSNNITNGEEVRPQDRRGMPGVRLRRREGRILRDDRNVEGQVAEARCESVRLRRLRANIASSKSLSEKRAN